MLKLIKIYGMLDYGYNDILPPEIIDTTSRVKSPFSPFYLGPVPLYEGFVAQNMENAWQYAKVYKEFIREDGVLKWWEYIEWAQNGWKSRMAQRYPMGRNAKPEYSFWNNKKLSYIEARKQIYAPLYASCVVRQPEFWKLQDRYRNGEQLHLWDFDGYHYHAYEHPCLKEVINNPHQKMGHAFVLAALIMGVDIVND